MYIGILKCAIEMAKKSKMYPYRLGSVIFKGKKILSCGFNQIRSSSNIPIKYKKFLETLHAEQHAIMQIKNKKDLQGLSLLIIRINRNEKLANAYPCKKCMESIKHFGIDQIYYSNQNGEIIAEKIFNN